MNRHFGTGLAGLALCVQLASCGGGGGNEAPIPQATATTVSGTFDQSQYTDSDCKQPRMILDLPTVEGTVTFKLVETVQLEDTHSPIGINYLGTADKVDATIKPSDQPNPQTRYLALQGENQMRMETKLPLSGFGLTYTRTLR
jgi:hypothetical protein